MDRATFSAVMLGCLVGVAAGLVLLDQFKAQITRAESRGVCWAMRGVLETISSDTAGLQKSCAKAGVEWPPVLSTEHPDPDDEPAE